MEGSVCLCQWVDARYKKSTQGWSLSQLADTNLPKSSWKSHEKSGRRAGCRLPREGTKLHSLSTKPVMNWKGWVELKSRFPAFAEVPFQPGLPQFYNVLEFTFTCLLIHSSAHWEVFICLTSTFAIWCRKLCNFRRGRGQASVGHIGILSWFLGGRSHKILWKGENPLCIRLLCSWSWLVLIFIRNVGGNLWVTCCRC